MDVVDALIAAARDQSGRGDWPAARQHWYRALERDPNRLETLLEFSQQLIVHRQYRAAQVVLDRARALHPNVAEAAMLAGHGALQERRWGDARRAYQLAMGLAADLPEADLGLALALEQLGEREEAEVRRQAAFAKRPVWDSNWGSNSPNSPILLVLSSVGGGNAPLQAFVPSLGWRWRVVAPEYFPRHSPLPPHDLVYNAISDADAAGKALASADELLRQSDRPVVNHPRRLMGMGREEMAQWLSRIPGARTPRMVRVHRRELLDGSARARLIGQGWRFPVILRQPGRHNGEDMLLVSEPEDLARAAGHWDGETVLVIEWLRTHHGAEFRKYRLFWVGKQWYPVHRVTSKHWVVHGFSSDLAERPADMAIEREFLTNPGAILGARATEAVNRLGLALPFDIGGIDLDVSDNGEVQVFEANATMVVLPPDPGAIWDARRRAYAKVVSAIDKYLRRRVYDG
jgi:hypothetical protein